MSDFSTTLKQQAQQSLDAMAGSAYCGGMGIYCTGTIIIFTGICPPAAPQTF